MNKENIIHEPFSDRQPMNVEYSLYARFYDKVFDQKEAYESNINKISPYLDKNSNILDVGTGTGKHYKLLKKHTKNVIGIDKIIEFIDRAKIRNPDGNFIEGDVLYKKHYNENTFTHITCLFDTIHHNILKDKLTILQNFKFWLKPNGYIFINVLLIDKLDPSPRDYSQYYYDSDKRKHSLTYFDNMTHDAWWIDDKYYEKYINKDGKSFVKIHQLYIEKLDILYVYFKNAGFKIKDVLKYGDTDITDMVLCILEHDDKE